MMPFVPSAANNAGMPMSNSGPNQVAKMVTPTSTVLSCLPANVKSSDDFIRRDAQKPISRVNKI